MSQKVSAIYFSLTLLFIIASCREKAEFPFLTGMAGFNIVLKDPGGDPLNPLPFSTTPVKFTLKILAFSYEGEEPFRGFTGWVRLSSKPGTLSLIGAKAGPDLNTVLIQNGESESIKVQINYAFGETYIWVESLGYTPASENQIPACSDSVDNDNDGVTDFPLDLGCATPNDNTEIEEEHYYGVSPTIYFKTPKISVIQKHNAALAGSFVTITEGDMIATRITADGFYVTDLADSGGYNHIFAFTFNTPENLRVCDRITRLSGIVKEFYGFTELTTPSFVNEFWDEKKEKCRVPEPIVLSATDVKNNAVMEALESALVQVKNPRLGSKFINCDLNGDGDVDWRDYNTNECSPECQCKEDCEKDTLCTELTQFKQYGQFAVALDAHKIFVVTKGSPIDFDPLKYNGKNLIFNNITGTLRNVSFLRPQWIIEPRCNDDLNMVKEYIGSDKACIQPRIISEE